MVIEQFICAYNGKFLAGVDEVGRGPLAGPVVAAAVILDPDNPIEGLADSKKLSEKKREKLYAEIIQKSLAFNIAEASVTEIDEINILHASMLAMKRAIEGLSIRPEYVLIDGNKCPDVSISSEAVVKGDSRVECISAASIIAKVYRDRMMVELDALYPGYGLAQHKGYPTKSHLSALQALGVNKLYRTSFKPVAKLL